MPTWDIRQIAVCEAKGIPVPREARILDYGCGAGRRVYELLDAGYSHAEGYDVQDYLALRDQADRVRFHIAPDGHVPVPDATFDFVFSDQVFEHVMDQPLAFREIVRVLKPGGVSVHVIPAKWQPIEPHIRVPLGGLRPFKFPAWYFLWAALGIRANGHRSLTAREVAQRNCTFARTKLNYWSCRQYRRLFSTLAIRWSWEEVTYMQASYKPRILQLARLAQRVPLLTSLVRTCWTRVLMFRKTLIAEAHGTPAHPGARRERAAAVDRGSARGGAGGRAAGGGQGDSGAGRPAPSAGAALSRAARIEEAG